MLIAVLIAATVLAPPTSGDVETRVQHVVNGLLPETAFRDRYSPPAPLAERMAYYHTPGVSIAVINDGRIEWARGFGVRERDRPEPVTEETIFQAGSISKPIFALGVMRLAQERRLDLDQDVNGYLKSWQVPANSAWQPCVTLRQILSHSAGLTVHGFPGYGVDEVLPTVVQILNGDPPANTPPVVVNILPGVQTRYSGGGTTVGQLLVTDVMGESFPTFMRTLVLDPLEMAHSTYEQPLPSDWAIAAATAHPWKGRPLAGRWHVYPEMAAAGLWTTPSDLGRAGIEVQRALDGKGKFLSQETALAMLTPSNAGEDVALGFFLQGEGDAVRFGHGGWDEGFVARTVFYKKGGQGAVVMVNSNEGAPLIDEILRAVAREYSWPGYFPEKIKASPSSDILDRYVGAYAAKAFKCVVTRSGDLLMLTVPGQPAFELRPTGESTFEAVGLNSELAFDKVEGSIALTMTQDGRSLTAKRD
jgi:CubicO group peptidase (beta-lactamase class C family)